MITPTKLSVVVPWDDDWRVYMEAGQAGNMAIRDGLKDGHQSQVGMQSGNMYEVTRQGNIVVVEKVVKN